MVWQGRYTSRFLDVDPAKGQFRLHRSVFSDAAVAAAFGWEGHGPLLQRTESGGIFNALLWDGARQFTI